ncbi:hypothetical protein HQ459_01895, partial [bacterium]|nr:hypothetical protein [bacterium]
MRSKVEFASHVNRFWKTSVVVIALIATTVSCGGNETSQTRNATLVAGTACTKLGQVSKVSKVSVVCAKTPASNMWYATISARGKSVACPTPGNVRKKKAVVWVCGLAKGKKQWRATAPLPPKVIEASSNSIPVLPILIPTLESTDLATPAQPVVADNKVLADPTIIDQTPEPTASTPATTTPATSTPAITTPAVTVPFEPVSIVNWATTGSGPYAIAIDKNGNIYTPNFGANNVTKITPNGTSTILGTTGSSPCGIAIDNDGNIYTANLRGNNVTKITPNGISTTLG